MRAYAPAIQQAERLDKAHRVHAPEAMPGQFALLIALTSLYVYSMLSS